MEEDRVFKNKDLVSQSDEDFIKSIHNDFIDDDFISQLEWGLLLTQNKMKQMEYIDGWPSVTMNTFDKSFLLSGKNGLVDDNRIFFFKHWGNYQANPSVFPQINLKTFTIADTISFNKVKELPLQEKRNLIHKPCKYIFEHSMAFYKKDTESFYGQKLGYGINPVFFNLNTRDEKTFPISLIEANKLIEKQKITDKATAEEVLVRIIKREILNNFFHVPLRPGYVINDKYYSDIEIDQIWDYHYDAMTKILFTFQAALTLYYEWTIYIREYDNIGFVIPIEPTILSELYKTSLINFENKKRMLHFVRDHYRRKAAIPTEDYSIYVQKYLRGENKFNYRGFYAEIIPPQYDLLRVKTKKKFIDPIQEQVTQ